MAKPSNNEFERTVCWRGPRLAAARQFVAAVQQVVRRHMEATPNARTSDRNGTVVEVGTIVRVLAVRDSVLARLPEEEAARVKSMKGAVLSVYEIDEYGSAWVQKWWHIGEKESLSHSLALEPSEMEVVRNGNSDA